MFRATRWTGGVTTIVLPFATLVGGADFPDVSSLQQRLGVGFVTPPVQSMDVYVTLPLTAEDVQAFPQPSSRTPYVRYPDNQTQNSVQWTLTARQTITVSYVDSQIQLWYAISLVIGSIFIGALLSGMLELIKSSSGKSNLFGKSRPNDQLGEKYALGFAVLVSMLIVYGLFGHKGRKSKSPTSY